MKRAKSSGEFTVDVLSYCSITRAQTKYPKRIHVLQLAESREAKSLQGSGREPFQSKADHEGLLNIAGV